MATSTLGTFARASLFTGILGLVACGIATDHSRPPERVATTAEALSTSYSISVTLPTGTSIVDTTVGASAGILLNSGDKVLGPIAAGGSAPVEVKGLGMSGSITSGGGVFADPLSVVNGNIVAGGVIVSLGASVSGTQTALSGTRPYTTTWSVTNSGTSQGAIALANNAIAAPTPGTYDGVVVLPGSSLYLQSGTYFFQSLDLEPGANLFVDSRQGPVFLYVINSLLFRGNEIGADSGKPELFLAFLGTCEVDLEAPFNGVFLAPNAPLLHMEDALWVLDPVKQPRGNTGAFYSNSIVVDAGEIIKPTTFNWTTVPGMPIPPGGWAANGGPRGSGTPGSGATGGGGTGTGGGVSQVITKTPTGLPLVISVDPTNSATNTATQTSATPITYTLPSSFDVGGELGNNTVTLSCSNGGTTVTCTYRGGSPTSNPTAVLDLEAGRTANFVSCTDGLPANTPRVATSCTLTANPLPNYPLTINLPLDDNSCSHRFDILTPYQTRQMHDSFAWPDPKLQTPPLVQDPNPDGTPALYYAWVYVKSAQDILSLRKLYVHMLTRPLFTQEIEPYTGKCGVFQNPGDGTGMFVPVLMPGTVYNTLLNVQNSKFQGAPNNLKVDVNNNVYFDAVILRNNDVPASARNANGSINFQTLKNSGFRYLSYESLPLPTQDSMQLNASTVVAILDDAYTFVLQTVRLVGQTITNALGSLDAIFSNTVTFNITLNALNTGSVFPPSTAMTRVWGPLGGQPMGAGGLEVTLMENISQILPTTFIGHTDDSGFVSIQPAQHTAVDVRGSGMCVQFSNSATWQNSFLMPDDMCDFTAFDPKATSNATSTFKIPDFNEDRNLVVQAWSEGLALVYEMTDAYNYMRDVAAHRVKTAHVLVGDVADTISSIFNNNKAFTFCFRLENDALTDVNTFLTPYFNGSNISYPLTRDAASLVFYNFANNDILTPVSAANGQLPNGGGAREVGSHEYGHFILCNLLLEQSGATNIDALIGDSIQNQGGDIAQPTRYINEAFADYISGQVTGIANYSWVSLNNQPPPFNFNQLNGRACTQTPCYDQNFATGWPPVAHTKDKTGIARTATLFHDVFDGHRNCGLNGVVDPFCKELAVPDDADFWAVVSGSNPQVISYSAAETGDTDGPNTTTGPDANGNVYPGCRPGTGPAAPSTGGSAPPACRATEDSHVDGSFLVQLGHNLASNSNPGGGDFLNDAAAYKSADSVMVSAGVNWCQRCAVLALHSATTGASVDNQSPLQLMQQCTGGDSFLQSTGVPSGNPPDPNLNVDYVSCSVCPAHTAADPAGTGTCLPCPYSVVAGKCVQCPADIVISGSGTSWPLGQSEWPTTKSNATNDTCPNEFWLEVDQPDAFFAKGANELEGWVDGSASQALCQATNTMTYEPESSIGFGFSTDVVISRAGTWTPTCGNFPCVNPCTGVASKVIASVSQLPTLNGSVVPFRFGTPVINGVNFVFDAPTTATPPP